MKHKIFISYLHQDENKVKIIQSNFKGHPQFETLVIAANPKPSKALTLKVEEGINESTMFIPILTSRSISAQWINQEIGYAFAKGKMILPLVESGLLNQLKGFVHKEIDLPFKFDSDNYSKKEDLNFDNAVKLLKEYLEREYYEFPILVSQVELPIKPKLSPLKEQLRKRMKRDEDLKFLQSPTGREAGKKEALNLFHIVQQEIVEYRKENLVIISNEDFRNLAMSFQSKTSLVNIWARINEENRIILTVVYSTGEYPQGFAIAGTLENIKQYSLMEFYYDLDNEIGIWKHKSRNEDPYTSEEISNMAMQWLVQKVMSSPEPIPRYK